MLLSHFWSLIIVATRLYCCYGSSSSVRDVYFEHLPCKGHYFVSNRPICQHTEGELSQENDNMLELRQFTTTCLGDRRPIVKYIDLVWWKFLILVGIPKTKIYLSCKLSLAYIKGNLINHTLLYMGRKIAFMTAFLYLR